MVIGDLILKAADEGKASDVREVISLLGEKFTEAEILEAIRKLEEKGKDYLKKQSSRACARPHDSLQDSRCPARQ